MKILYITYVDMITQESGSGVRPIKMLQAMREEGHDVDLIYGNQLDSNRKIIIKDFMAKMDWCKYDLCYIESSTYPILLHCDRKLIKMIHDAGIPIGYFYRDFYRKFPDEFPHPKRSLAFLKDLWLDFMQKLTDRILDKCDIVYFPSIEASKLFHYRDMRELPPACDVANNLKNEKNYTCIYVGGILNQYDGNLLLNTFEKLYYMNHEYRLILVCREKEWALFDNINKNAKWLTVLHVSGSELEEVYSKASVGIVVPNKQRKYNSFLVSVKLYEYIAHGLPIVSVNCNAMSRIIDHERIGVTSDPDEMMFAQKINEILCDDNRYDYYHNNVIAAALKNTWRERVKTIISDLVR